MKVSGLSFRGVFFVLMALVVFCGCSNPSANDAATTSQDGRASELGAGESAQSKKLDAFIQSEKNNPPQEHTVNGSSDYNHSQEEIVRQKAMQDGWSATDAQKIVDQFKRERQ